MKKSTLQGEMVCCWCSRSTNGLFSLRQNCFFPRSRFRQRAVGRVLNSTPLRLHIAACLSRCATVKNVKTKKNHQQGTEKNNIPATSHTELDDTLITRKFVADNEADYKTKLLHLALLCKALISFAAGGLHDKDLFCSHTAHSVDSVRCAISTRYQFSRELSTRDSATEASGRNIKNKNQ